MKILIYCYGPLSLDKERYCENFVNENKNYSLVSCHAIREQICGSKFAKDKMIELKVRDRINEECLKVLNKKNKNLIINGLFLNEASRTSLIENIEKKFKDKLKKVAISFLPTSATSTYEALKLTNEFKDIDFEYVRGQFFNFKPAKKSEEGDLLISKIEDSSDGGFNLETKIWGKEEIISCKNLQKVSEFIKHINSF